MALAKMCKARAAVHKSVLTEVTQKLQNLGCCQFASKTEGIKDGAVAQNIRTALKLIEERIADAKFVCRVLEPYEQNKAGGMAKMLGDMPEVSSKKFYAATTNEHKFANQVAWLRKKEKESTDLRSELAKLKAQVVQLSALEKIEYPLELFSAGTEEISGSIYTVPANVSDALETALDERFAGMVEFKRYAGEDKESQLIFAVLCRHCDLEKLRETASEFSLTKIEIAREFTDTALVEKALLEAKISVLEKQDAKISEELSEKADEVLGFIRVASDFLAIRRDRALAILEGEPTENIYIWDLWIPRDRFKDVEAVFKEYEDTTDFAEIEPEEGETAPTLLKNPGWSNSLEPLTLMYGTPTYGAVDPTTVMAPFFFLFLGMCFGDAGYGLILSALFGYYLVRYKLSPTLRKFFIMLFVGMVCTVIFGAISGSFFGDAITAFGFMKPVVPLAKKLQLLDPMNDPMTLLTISLILGFIQVIFGVCLAFYMNWKNGEKFAAIADQGGWIIFLVGLVMVGLTMSGKLPASLALVSKLLAIGGALLLFLTQGRDKPSIFGKAFSGLMSLYNVTGYLGDVLSYSRLLALGLGSAAVGLVINLLCNLIAPTRFVGIPLAIALFVFGHSFSIAVNLLGAFIHPLRLQYVEFFGKFYDANGMDFKPLRKETQFAKITD